MCERCNEIKKKYPGYEYCPWCGDHLIPEEVRQAVNILSGYCNRRWNCTECLFHDSENGGCLFKQGKSPLEWDTY